MKKFAIVAVMLVLTLSMMTACGCTAQDSGMVTMPTTGDTVFPTNIPETTQPTQAATEPMTMPIPDPTEATGAEDSTEIGNDTQDSTTTETDTGARSRMR